MQMLTPRTPIEFSDPLPEAVDVVVIGAGIVGTSTAWFLAKQGKKVLLAEKGRVGAEQSSRNWGFVRQQSRDAAELPIMMEANRIWRGLAAETGMEGLAFTQSACVQLADNVDALARMEAWRELGMQHQLDTRMLTRAEITEKFPALSGDFVGGMMTASAVSRMILARGS